MALIISFFLPLVMLPFLAYKVFHLLYEKKLNTQHLKHVLFFSAPVWFLSFILTHRIITYFKHSLTPPGPAAGAFMGNFFHENLSKLYLTTFGTTTLFITYYGTLLFLYLHSKNNRQFKINNSIFIGIIALVVIGCAILTPHRPNYFPDNRILNLAFPATLFTLMLCFTWLFRIKANPDVIINRNENPDILDDGIIHIP